MCFSAGASFGASAFLAVAGVVAIVKAKTIRQRLFAAIPLIFSVQQLSEGLLWLSLKHHGLTAGAPFFIYTFLVFAMLVWPLWIPLTISLLEKEARRKKIMTVFVITGAVVSLCFGCILLLYPVHANAAQHHIHYGFDFPPAIKDLVWVFNILYFITTVITPFISSIKRMKLLGIIAVASYLFTVIFYNSFVVSVWCYFAALLSIVVLWILMGQQKKEL